MSDMPRSRALFERAIRLMPGGNTRTTVFTPPHPVYASHGSGCIIVDVEGQARLDFVNNHTSLIHGHAHPAIVAAVTAQLGRGTAFSMPTEAEIELAEVILARVRPLAQIRFTNSGTEATMMAVKAARAYTGRPRIAKFEGAYHGTYDYVEISLRPGPSDWGPGDAPRGVPTARGTPEKVREDVVVLPFNDAGASQRLIERHAGELAAVVVDPLPSQIALVPATLAFLGSLREVTRAHGILLISDEVMSFRLSYHGALAAMGVQPDLLCLGKIIGGGLPVGAVAGSSEVMAVFDPRGNGPAVPHGGTFNANTATMAAGQAAMELLTPAALDRLNAMGERLRREANAALAEIGVPGQVTGAGSLFRVHMTSRPLSDYRSAVATVPEREAYTRLYRYLLVHGIFITSTGLGCLSTPMSEAEVDAFIQVFRAALKEEALRVG